MTQKEISYFLNPVVKNEFIISIDGIFIRVSFTDFNSQSEAEDFCKSIVNKLNTKTK